MYIPHSETRVQSRTASEFQTSLINWLAQQQNRSRNGNLPITIKLPTRIMFSATEPNQHPIIVHSFKIKSASSPSNPHDPSQNPYILCTSSNDVESQIVRIPETISYCPVKEAAWCFSSLYPLGTKQSNREDDVPTHLNTNQTWLSWGLKLVIGGGTEKRLAEWDEMMWYDTGRQTRRYRSRILQRFSYDFFDEFI